MPRLTVSTPKYRKHKASGKAFVELNGRRFYLGPHGSKTSIAEYDRLIAEWLANGRRLPSDDHEEPEALTVTQLCVHYWKFCQGYYRKNGKPTSEVAAVRIVLRDVRRLYGKLPAGDFTPNKLKAMRQVWIQRDISRAVVNQNAGRLVRMFRWGVAEELVRPDTVQALAAVPGLRKGRTEAWESSPVLPVDDKTVQATLPHLGGIVQDMVRLQLLTGMRPGEVCLVRPLDIDRSGEVWVYRPESHKTEHHGRQRQICLGPEAQSVLAP